MNAPALAWLVGCMLVAGCRSVEQTERTEIVVFAASSLRESFPAIETGFEAQHPEFDVVFAFGGSQSLATQLIEGARADVFASADAFQLDRVGGERTLRARARFASNRLVVVVPTDSEIRTPDQLGTPGLRVVLAAESVPAGRYARRALDLLGLRQRVEANVVSNELDVAGVIGRVSSGDAQAGIAYVTDLRGSKGLIGIELGVDVRARYELAVLGDAQGTGGELFTEFVTGSGGQAILAEFGFQPASVNAMASDD